MRARVTQPGLIGFSPITDVFQISDVLIDSPEPASLSPVGPQVTSDHHLGAAERGERRKRPRRNAQNRNVQVHVLLKVTEMWVMMSELGSRRWWGSEGGDSRNGHGTISTVIGATHRVLSPG